MSLGGANVFMLNDGSVGALGECVVFATALRPDFRRHAEADEAVATCRRCGVRVYLLPEDRRLGYCFDCYDPSEVRPALY